MNKLLWADLTRLKKNKIFWICVAGMFLFGTVLALNKYRQGVQLGWIGMENFRLDDFFTEYGPMIGIFCAVFSGLFVGTDYSDGTIRNKINIGHSRRDIYLSNLIVCSIAGLVILAGWFLSIFTVGVALFGWFAELTVLNIISYILISIFLVFSSSAIFVMLGMLISNKANAAVASILVFLGMLLLASYMDSRLSEPESYVEALTVTENGVELSEPKLNPDYVTGVKRQIFEFIRAFIPMGQGILISNRNVTHPVPMILYSIFLTFALTWIGIKIFTKKDLK